jgi:hypothetical protein
VADFNTPPFDVKYSLLCAQKEDGSTIVLQVDNDGKLPVTEASAAAILAAVTPPTRKHAFANLSASDDPQTLVAAVVTPTAKKIRVVALLLTTADADAVITVASASDAISADHAIVAGSGFVMPVQLETFAGEALAIYTSGAIAVTLDYVEV